MFFLLKKLLLLLDNLTRNHQDVSELLASVFFILFYLFNLHVWAVQNLLTVNTRTISRERNGERQIRDSFYICTYHSGIRLMEMTENPHHNHAERSNNFHYWFVYCQGSKSSISGEDILNVEINFKTGIRTIRYDNTQYHLFSNFKKHLKGTQFLPVKIW